MKVFKKNYNHMKMTTRNKESNYSNKMINNRLSSKFAPESL